MTGQSHFMLNFLLRKVTLRGHINSIKWPPHPQASVPPPEPKEGGHHLLRLRGQFGRLEKKPGTLSTLCYVQKKHKIRQPNEFYCTLYSTVQSHQLRKVTLRGHTNSVLWMYAVCRLCKVTFIQLNQWIFDRSDFPDFYTIKSLRVGDFGVKIKKNLQNI